MSVSPASSGLNAIQQGYRLLNQAGFQLAHNTLPPAPNEPDAGIEQPVVDLKRAEAQVSAGAKLIQAEDRLLGRLLDIKA